MPPMSRHTKLKRFFKGHFSKSTLKTFIVDLPDGPGLSQKINWDQDEDAVFRDTALLLDDKNLIDAALADKLMETFPNLSEEDKSDLDFSTSTGGSSAGERFSLRARLLIALITASALCGILVLLWDRCPDCSAFRFPAETTRRQAIEKGSNQFQVPVHFRDCDDAWLDAALGQVIMMSTDNIGDFVRGIDPSLRYSSSDGIISCEQ